MKITIIKKMPTVKLHTKEERTETTKEASVKQIARQYAAYKLAALRYLDSVDKLDEDTMYNILLQNR